VRSDFHSSNIFIKTKRDKIEHSSAGFEPALLRLAAKFRPIEVTVFCNARFDLYNKQRNSKTEIFGTLLIELSPKGAGFAPTSPA